MNPADLRTHLAAYADGELASPALEEVEAHLAKDAGARAEVQKWQALRHSANRAVTNEPVPAELEARIRAGLRKSAPRRSPRIYRLGYSGLAVAAAVALAFFIWPAGAAATSVKACGFAKVYRACAIKKHHDTLNARAGLEWDVFAKLDQNGSFENVRQNADFTCALPDLCTTGTYRLEGGCQCAPADGIRVVHAYFRCTAEPFNVVSVFAVDKRIQLCGEDGSACPGCKAHGREYHTAKDGNVTLVAWDHNDHSYVMCCGRLTREQIIDLSNRLDVAVFAHLDRLLAVAGGS